MTTRTGLTATLGSDVGVGVAAGARARTRLALQGEVLRRSRRTGHRLTPGIRGVTSKTTNCVSRAGLSVTTVP